MSDTDLALGPVFPKIFRYLDWKSKKVVRQVCRSWKEELDEIGLNVIIDTREAGNAGFVSRAVLERINITHVDAQHKCLSLKHPNLILAAKCSGRVEPIWFIKDFLQKCDKLVELHLIGSFLISQEIGNLERVKPGVRLYMKYLKTLRIEFGMKDCEKYIRSQEPQGNFQRLLSIFGHHKKDSLTFLRHIIDKNVTFLLSQIRSPRLSFFYLFVDPMQFLDDENNAEFEKYTFEWKRDPIESFLEHHRNPLRRVHLPCFEGKDFIQLNWRMYPERLKTLELTLFQFDTGKPSLMEKLILGQKCLEEFCFDNNYIGNDSYEPLHFKQMIVNNSETLRYINLTMSAKEKHLLNGNTFSNCSCLETFIIEETSTCCKFKHFNSLPKSLKTIKIRSAVVVDVVKGHVLEFNKFHRLEVLELFDIRVKPINLQAFTQTIVRCVMNALHCRLLNYLVMDFANELLLIRDRNLTKAMIAFGTLTTVDIYEPFHLLEIYGPNKECPRFLDIPPLKRAEVSHWRDPPKTPPECTLEQITVYSNVFHTSGFDACESCFGGCGCVNPASLE